MRLTACVVLFTGISFAQNLTEFGAAAMGGSIGGASGKKVSDGLTTVLGKVGEQTAKAAKKEDKATEPALLLAPGVTKEDTGGVPLPPPLSGRQGVTAPQLPLRARVALPQEVAEMSSLVSVTPALPPPPEMSPEGLKTVSAGMSRADVLKLGAPASRITMFDNGHLSETYSYRQQGRKVGTVRLTDGAVAGVEVQ